AEHAAAADAADHAGEEGAAGRLQDLDVALDPVAELGRREIIDGEADRRAASAGQGGELARRIGLHVGEGGQDAAVAGIHQVQVPGADAEGEGGEGRPIGLQEDRPEHVVEAAVDLDPYEAFGRVR